MVDAVGTIVTNNAGLSLAKASNLSDLASAATARTNLGLGTLATQSGTFSGTSSGTNTGDQTTITGNAGTATALQTARAINGVSFDGTAAITVTASAGTLTGSTLASGVTGSSLVSGAGGTFGTAAYIAAATKLEATNGVAVGLTTATVPSTGNSVANKTYVDALGLNQGWVNVKNAPYNAVGNGASDDTAALQSALNSGLNVFLPSGDYKITASLTNSMYRKINGQGRSVSSISATTTNTALVFASAIPSSGDINASFELKDLAIYAKNAVAINQVGITNWDSQSAVANIRLIHCTFSGTYQTLNDPLAGTTNVPTLAFLVSEGVGIKAAKLYDSLIQNCFIFGFGIGVYLDACDINNIDTCRLNQNARHIHLTKHDGVGSQNKIKNNDILINWRVGGIYEDQTRWNTIEDNYFESNYASSQYWINYQGEGTTFQNNRIDAPVGTIPIISINAGGPGVILAGNRGGSDRTIEILHDFWNGNSAQQTLVQFADNLSTFPETLSPQSSYTKRSSSRVWGPYSPKRLLGNASTNWPWGTTSGGLPGISTVTSGNLIVQMATESTDDSLEVAITAEAAGGYVNVKWGGTSVWLADWSTSTNLQTVTRQIVRPSGVLPDSGLVFEFAAGQGYICGIQLTPSPQNIQGATLTISTNTALSGTVAVQAAAAGSAATHFPVFTATPASTATTVKMRTAAEVRSDIGAGTGSVTSVAMTVPSLLSITGSPITTSGTLAVSYSGTALPVANGGTGLTALGSGVTTGLAAATTGTLGFVRSDSPDITGSMSVDGATFKVDGVNNRVGVNNASPAYTLDVFGRISYNTSIGEGADVTLSSSGTTIQHALSATWVAQNFYAGGTNAIALTKSGTTILGPLSLPAGMASTTEVANLRSATTTALANARTINGTSFDGTANITVTAAAATLTGLGTGVGTALGLTPTGSGVIVLATNAVLTTPTLGVASATSMAVSSGLTAGSLLSFGSITAGTTIAAGGAVTGSNLSGNNTGDQTITLTGAVTGSGTGSFATTLATVTETKGGTAQTTYSTGDTLYASAANTLAKRAIGSSGQVLTVSGGVPTWATPSSGGSSTAWVTFSGSDSAVAGLGNGAFVATSQTVTMVAHGLVTGDVVWFTSDMGATIQLGIPYYVTVLTSSTFKLSVTTAARIASTFITADTTGNNYMTHWTSGGTGVVAGAGVDGISHSPTTATGKFVIGFSAAMTDDKYVMAGSAQVNVSGTPLTPTFGEGSVNTTNCSVWVYNYSSTLSASPRVSVNFTR